MSSKPLIEINNLSFQYDSKKVIFDNITFNINEGSFHGLIGSNGCGKTTLFKMIIGGIQGYSGKINFNINDKIVSYFPSHISFPSNLTVFKYLKNELRLIWKCNANLKLRIIELLKKFNISDCFNKDPNHLSSGQQKQVELIRIILEQPKLIFLDEPIII